MGKVLFEIELIRVEGREDDFDENDDNTNVQQAITDSKTRKAPQTPEPGTKNILLKGQMKHIKDIDAIIFLCSPMYKIFNRSITTLLISTTFRINDLDELPELGIFLNDLNSHGLSKEMVLAGWQHNSKFDIVVYCSTYLRYRIFFRF